MVVGWENVNSQLNCASVNVKWENRVASGSSVVFVYVDWEELS